jgi:hypothetical protein
MLNYYQKLCLVNPHLFDSSKVIDQHFRSGLIGKKHLGNRRNVKSSITSTLAKNDDLEYESVCLLNLCDNRDKRMFRLALETHSDTMSFIFQNGTISTYLEFQKMLSNGEFQRITGGATSVEMGHIFRI